MNGSQVYVCYGVGNSLATAWNSLVSNPAQMCAALDSLTTTQADTNYQASIDLLNNWQAGSPVTFIDSTTKASDTIVSGQSNAKNGVFSFCLDSDGYTIDLLVTYNNPRRVDYFPINTTNMNITHASVSGLSCSK
ncbi:MAG: hypothetical protein ACYC2R_06135 [Burkholderiales bacterium]